MSKTNGMRGEQMFALSNHVDMLNAKMRAAKVPMGSAVSWLDKNIPDWKTSVNGMVKIAATRFGYEKAYPLFEKEKPPPKPGERGPGI